MPPRCGGRFGRSCSVLPARLLKALLAKGVSLARLSGADLAFKGQAFVVFDGNRLRGCHDAAAAINVVCHAKRWCSAVDLSAIRQAAPGTEEIAAG